MLRASSFTVIRRARETEARRWRIVAVPLRFEDYEMFPEVGTGTFEEFREFGENDLGVSEVLGPDAFHVGGEPLDPSVQLRGAVSPWDAGFVSVLAHRGGSEFGVELRPSRLQVASRVAVADRPRTDLGQGFDRLDTDISEDGFELLFLHPVVPQGHDEAALYSGINTSAERVGTPSVAERELDIIPAREDTAPTATTADAFGCGLAGVMLGGVADRREFSLGVGTGELLPGEGVPVSRPTQRVAAVREDDAQLDQFEGDDVDPADVDEGRRTEERMRRVVERRPCPRRFRLTGRGA